MRKPEFMPKEGIGKIKDLMKTIDVGRIMVVKRVSKGRWQWFTVRREVNVFLEDK